MHQLLVQAATKLPESMERYSTGVFRRDVNRATPTLTRINLQPGELRPAHTVTQHSVGRRSCLTMTGRAHSR
jgi:hypothetical protein